jgi:hypothetical protein
MLATRSIRISAVLGAATVAGLSIGAASAEACQTNPPPGHPCAGSGTIPASDIQYREAGSTVWTDADAHGGIKNEPAGGVVDVRINPKSWYATASCTRDVSLASYETHGPTWATSGEQVFVGYATAKLSVQKPTATLTVPLPGAAADKPTCWGQVDLYFGTTIFDGHTGAGHGPLPHYPNGVFPNNLISAWNGGTGSCEATPPTTPPPTTPPTSPSTKPTTSTPAPPTTTTTSVRPTTSAPSTPGTPTPTTPTPTSSTSTAPPPVATTPGTPTLAHTGSNAGPLAAGALGLLGAGSAVMFTARRAARRH